MREISWSDMTIPVSSVAIRGCFGSLVLALAVNREAVAGMPSITLTDVARLRFEAISFFVALFLGSTWCVRAIWNGLRGDFPRLPRLSFARASGLVAIWGLLFLLVLTMISGARELMTPGAWKKQGLTFKLADAPKVEPASPPDTEPARRATMERLRGSLWRYAELHEGRLPAGRVESGFADQEWLIPDPAPIHYVYVPGLRVDSGKFAVAYEPGIFGPDRLVLLADGSIAKMSLEAIQKAKPPGGSP